MAESTFPRCLALVLLLCVSVTTSTSDTAATTTDDVTEEAMKLIKDIRQFAVVAKKGVTLSSISESAEKMKERAEGLLKKLPENADSCETNSVIKMAAARIASAQILTLLQAEGQKDVLHGRLSMSFGFLESVAQMIEDELALSTNIGGQLAAIVFGADITDSIAKTSSSLVQASAPNNGKTNVKRQWTLSGQASWSQSSGFGAHAGLSYHFRK